MKHDAGKTPTMQGLFEYFPRALMAVADVSAFGFEKYKTWGGWRSVPDAVNRYANAKGRHMLAEAMGQSHDPESNLMHAAHEAWGALAKLEMQLKARDLPASTATPAKPERKRRGK